MKLRNKENRMKNDHNSRQVTMSGTTMASTMSTMEMSGMDIGLANDEERRRKGADV